MIAVWPTRSASDFQSEVGEVFGEIGGELLAKFGRRFSSFFYWGKSSEAYSAKTPPHISPSNFTTRFWVVAGPTTQTGLCKFGWAWSSLIRFGWVSSGALFKRSWGWQLLLQYVMMQRSPEKPRLQISRKTDAWRSLQHSIQQQKEEEKRDFSISLYLSLSISFSLSLFSLSFFSFMFFLSFSLSLSLALSLSPSLSPLLLLLFCFSPSLTLSPSLSFSFSVSCWLGITQTNARKHDTNAGWPHPKVGLYAISVAGHWAHLWAERRGICPLLEEGVGIAAVWT